MPPQIDYNALAKQAGAIDSQPAGAIDYTALAKQAGATDSQGGATSPPRSWTDSMGDFGSSLWKQINPVAGVKGAAQMAAHPIDTLKADADTRQQIYDQAEQSFKKGNYAEGAAHLLHSFIPLVGPQVDAAANDFLQGNYAKGAGAATGIGLAAAAPEAIKNLNISMPGAASAENLSERMYQSSLKPPPGSYSQPEVQSMVRTGLENKIPVSAAGRVKLSELISDLNDKVSDQIKAGSNSGVTINKFDVASRLGDTYSNVSNLANPEKAQAAVSRAGNEFIRNKPIDIPALDAQKIKVTTYQGINNDFGKLSSATIEAQKSLARGIKEELQNQFPEIKGLNASEGQAINLDGALERAINRTSNRDIFSLGGKIATGTGATVGAVAGGEAGAAVGAVAGPVLHHFLSDPAVQSHLAIAVYKASKGTVTLGAAQSRVASYVNALGNATQANLGQAATANASP